MSHQSCPDETHQSTDDASERHSMHNSPQQPTPHKARHKMVRNRQTDSHNPPRRLSSRKILGCEGLSLFLVIGSVLSAIQLYAAVVTMKMARNDTDSSGSVGPAIDVDVEVQFHQKNINIRPMKGTSTWDCAYFENKDVSGTPLATFSAKHLASDWQSQPGWHYDGVPMLNYKKSGFYLKCKKRAKFRGGYYKMMLYANCDYMILVLDNGILVLEENARSAAKDRFVDQDIVSLLSSTQYHDIEVTVGVLKEERSWFVFSETRIHSSREEYPNFKMPTIGAPDFSMEETIACGTTPICNGPRKKCKEMLTMGLGNGEKAWGLCRDFVSSNHRCLVYSFGIRDMYSAELLYGQNGCEVHAFDCTVNYPTSLGPNVTFHPWCLGSNPDELKLDGKLFNAETQAKRVKFMDLPSIIKHLGHENKALTILKMDCEGCEWNGLDTLFLTMPGFFSKISMLLLEMHFVSYMAPGTLERFEEIKTMSRVLKNLQDYRTYRYSINSDFSTWRFDNPLFYNELYDAGLFVGACCYEFSMVRKDIVD